MHAQIEHVVRRDWLGCRVKGQGVASQSQTRTMRALWRFPHFIQQSPNGKSRFNDTRSFFSCSDWAAFAVIQQMDALKAQEKTRFEEIRRNT
ncbi:MULTISPECIES: hypothetical protein [Pseudomonas]|uniref:Uncharacterized protein n=1 Tax=Pseudomonas tritici TaxID=2745518 RepID=A0A8H9YRN0_9PSED|nr:MULTISPECIES: hypothetical protein [Pseudomonas]MBP2873586.1 hypothetical protein [Pseudomonas sp. SWRI144]QXH81868.1 hypothetical protein HU722_0017870 [Pseudomonas tritici]